MRYTLALSLLSALCLNWSIQAYGPQWQAIADAMHPPATSEDFVPPPADDVVIQADPAPRIDIATYQDWYFEEGADLLTAVVFERDQIAQLPPETEAVVLSGVRHGCFGMLERLGDDQVVELQSLPNLRRVVLAVSIGEAGVAALTNMPALEELFILAFAPLTEDQIARLEALPALKILEYGDSARR